MIAAFPPGTRVTLDVRRGAGSVTLPATLGELEDEHPRGKQAKDERPASGPLGIEVGEARTGGALVERVSPNGPAAGQLAPGDIILEVDRQPVKSAADAREKLRRSTEGKPTLLRVEREGSSRWVAIDRAGGGSP
jgi:serine protease Do